MTTDQPKYERAKKRLNALKVWYWSIPMSLLASIILGGLSFLMHQNGEPNTIIWILMSGPMALWIILVVQGLSLYGKKPKAILAWEERQIRKYVEDNSQ